MAFKSKITPNIAQNDYSPSTVTPAVVGILDTLTVIGFSIANTSLFTITVSARLHKSAGSSAFIIKNATIDPGNTLVIVGGEQKVVLESGDYITTYSSGVNAADVILSYLT